MKKRLRRPAVVLQKIFRMVRKTIRMLRNVLRMVRKTIRVVRKIIRKLRILMALRFNLGIMVTPHRSLQDRIAFRVGLG
jgi:hypothetical protein